MKPMSMDDPAYPFLAFSGIPSMSFHFTSKNVSFLLSINFILSHSYLFNKNKYVIFLL